MDPRKTERCINEPKIDVLNAQAPDQNRFEEIKTVSKDSKSKNFTMLLLPCFRHTSLHAMGESLLSIPSMTFSNQS